MILSPMSPETVADATGDHAAIGRPFGQPAGGPVGPEPAVQSQLKALVRRIVEDATVVALILICFALVAMSGGL